MRSSAWRVSVLLCLPLCGWAGETASGPAPLSFRNDILPILSGNGCNAGSCHAKQGGQNGFQLTIFGFDPAADYREITRNARGRRIFPAAPEQSLLLLKATKQIDHEGGERIKPGSHDFKVLSDWIRLGAPLEIPGEPTLQSISAKPERGSYRKGQRQPIEVTAHFSDGSKRVVTEYCEFQSPLQSFVKVSEEGLMQVGNTPGDGVIIVRYLDRVAVSRVAVPPDRTLPKSAYASLPVRNEIDRLSWKRFGELGILPSKPCSDAEFLRRASLDATGHLPTPERARAFLLDPAKDKRERLIDELLADPNWADHWATKWRDITVGNTQRIGVKPVYLLDHWIRRKFRDNTPYDQFVRELLTAQGNSHRDGPVALWRDQRDPEMMSAYVSRIFLGVRLDCAKCHHHPSEKWGQDDYYQMAAFFNCMKSKGQGISAPISGEPEDWWFEPGGKTLHPVTGVLMKPKPPGGTELAIPEGADPRTVLVDWITRADNPYFSRAVVNRVWGEFFGRGIVHPVDDFRDSNPSVNDELLTWLGQDFVQHGFDLKHVMRRILNSALYQTSSLPNETNLADNTNFSRSPRRRLTAEVMLDAVCDVTGVRDSFDGLPLESRAVRTWNNKLPSVFLDTFGRPDSSADCPCERMLSPTMTQALHLLNSEALVSKLAQSDSLPGKLAAGPMPTPALIEEIYLRTFSRFPTPEEQSIAAKIFPASGDRRKATEDLTWALLNSAEFVFNH
ncbi:MAG: Protein of unknown function DUF1553/DUF1549 [Verrucomicrobia bacterium]|nr:MAG: Protein of unknown function DUF1553/DUF1549 [Verrucomicrobiota bacterium]